MPRPAWSLSTALDRSRSFWRRAPARQVQRLARRSVLREELSNCDACGGIGVLFWPACDPHPAKASPLGSSARSSTYRRFAYGSAEPKKNGRPSGVEGAPFQLKGVWGMRELIGATTVAGRFYSRHEAGRMRAADHWGHEEQCAVAPRTGPQ